MPDIVVLGIGNQYAGNDSAGVIVARILREKLPPFYSCYGVLIRI
jgi:Ni,Fe-hydrogenase maturation factor